MVCKIAHEMGIPSCSFFDFLNFANQRWHSLRDEVHFRIIKESWIFLPSGSNSSSLSSVFKRYIHHIFQAIQHRVYCTFYCENQQQVLDSQRTIQTCLLTTATSKFEVDVYFCSGTSLLTQLVVQLWILQFFHLHRRPRPILKHRS